MIDEKKDGAPLYMELEQAEYVRSRFNAMPKEVKNFFRLEDDFDARAHMEVCFRAEWYRLRHDQMQMLMVRAYKKHLAAKAVLKIFQNETGVDDARLEELLLNAFVAIGDVEQIPWGF